MLYPSLLVFSLAAASLLGGEPGLDLRWRVVGDPGNRDTTIEETTTDFSNGFEIGRVDAPYRILDTEVTVEQHFQFVLAYYPLYAKRVSQFGRSEFIGFDITALSESILQINPGTDPRRPSAMSWEYFARYCNWLHHGMVDEPWAFDDGAYDTSTFYEDPPGVWHYPLARKPGARYWIPNLDEWFKAAYWDPTLDNGAGGYWQFPTRSNEQPRPGYPQDGGQYNAGEEDDFPLAVRSYPDIRSYYGLYDLAGGRQENLENARSETLRQRRRAKGSQYYDYDPQKAITYDILGTYSTINAQHVPYGFRPAGREFPASDLNEDGRLDFFDVSLFIRMYLSGDQRVDFRDDDMLDADDVRVFIGLYEHGL